MSLNMDRFHGRVPESNAGCDARWCEAATELRQCATCLLWFCPDHLCEHQVELLATRLLADCDDEDPELRKKYFELADCDSSIQEPGLPPAQEVD
jgi:hypothetical protein